MAHWLKISWIALSLLFALNKGSQAIAEPTPPEPKTFPADVLSSFHDAAIKATCVENKQLKECFPSFFSQCTSTFKSYLDSCFKAELAALPPRMPEAALLEANQRQLVCAMNSVFAHNTMASTPAGCQEYVRATQERFEKMRASGFKPDENATASSAFVLENVAKSLSSVRCNGNVVRECFRVDEAQCNAEYKAAAEPCLKQIGAEYGATVNRNQGGEIATKVDSCVQKVFLPKVVQANPPTTECRAAMKAHW